VESLVLRYQRPGWPSALSCIRFSKASNSVSLEIIATRCQLARDTRQLGRFKRPRRQFAHASVSSLEPLCNSQLIFPREKAQE